MIGPEFTCEDLLRLIIDRAAFLKHFGDSAAMNTDVVPDRRAFSGLADCCEELESWTRAIHDALDADALGTKIGAGRKRRCDR